MDISEVVKDLHLISTTGALSGEVSAVCYNSRSCEENSLFVAVSGLNADGHGFIDDAIRRGARWIIHEKPFVSPDHNITALQVSDSRRALGITGRNFYARPSSDLCLIGITGTNGKTTVTYLLESIIAAAGFSPGVLGTVNYRYGGKTFPAPNTTPESLEFQKILRQMVNEGVTHCISEVSSHALDLGRVDDCDFDIAVFTNLTQDHLDYHRTMELYYEAKRRFFQELLPKSHKHNPYGAIINGDDPWGRRLREEIPGHALTFGLDGNHDIHSDRFNITLEGIEARIKMPGQALHITSPLIGRFNLYNILTAVAAAFAVGITPTAIEQGISRMKGVPGRMEKVNRPGEPHVFVDYAHTDDALSKAIENLSGFGGNRIITVFGCGGDRDQGKRPLMGSVAARLSDVVIVTSDNPRSEDPLAIIGQIEAGIRRENIQKVALPELGIPASDKIYCILPDRRAAIETAILTAGPADIVLIAGKGHEDYQIIGKERLFFDDRITARESLSLKSEGRS